jgi:hypothetical protein
MNRTSIPTLVGVFTSLLVIWALHTYIVVDDCLDNGGSFQYNTGKCLLENGQLYDSTLENMVVALYCVVGFVVSLLVSSLIRKFFNIKQS